MTEAEKKELYDWYEQVEEKETPIEEVQKRYPKDFQEWLDNL